MFTTSLINCYIRRIILRNGFDLMVKEALWSSGLKLVRYQPKNHVETFPTLPTALLALIKACSLASFGDIDADVML